MTMTKKEGAEQAVVAAASQVAQEVATAVVLAVAMDALAGVTDHHVSTCNRHGKKTNCLYCNPRLPIKM